MPLYLNASLLPVARSFNAPEALATVGEKLCVELSECLSRHGYSPFTAVRRSALTGQISAIIQPDNSVRQLMGKKARRGRGFRGPTKPRVFRAHVHVASLFSHFPQSPGFRTTYWPP